MRRYLANEMSTSPALPAARHSNVRLHKHARRPKPGAPPFPERLPELRDYFNVLLRAHGEQHWWPGQTPFEVIVGAILVQNTNWSNAERAIGKLRSAGLLTPRAIERVSQAKLARLVLSSGYFRQKARKLKEFVRFLRTEHRGSLKRMFQAPTELLRDQLQELHGIGPETADSILLYAGNRPVFVVDSYTRRVVERHELAQGKESYEGVRGLFERSLPNEAALFNEYHALLVHTGKHYCRKRAPLCSKCPLQAFLPRPVEGSR
jgi:endonuclease-3 related protein